MTHPIGARPYRGAAPRVTTHPAVLRPGRVPGLSRTTRAIVGWPHSARAASAERRQATGGRRAVSGDPGPTGASGAHGGYASRVGRAVIAWEQAHPAHSDVWASIFNPTAKTWGAPPQLPRSVPRGVWTPSVALTNSQAIIASQDGTTESDIWERALALP